MRETTPVRVYSCVFVPTRYRVQNVYGTREIEDGEQTNAYGLHVTRTGCAFDFDYDPTRPCTVGFNRSECFCATVCTFYALKNDNTKHKWVERVRTVVVGRRQLVCVRRAKYVFNSMPDRSRHFDLFSYEQYVNAYRLFNNRCCSAAGRRWKPYWKFSSSSSLDRSVQS